MPFPIVFVRNRNDFDFFAAGVNFTGNSAVVTVGSWAAAEIVKIGLQHFECSTTLIDRVAHVSGTLGVIGVIMGLSTLIMIGRSIG